ncbi:MauE/DoxX family redox-associated membrane protein [Parahaliea mediterranea]|uniref:Methylamine utilization protein MauE n=1 Tax=Parahaliea mediterranea TaxID=651086 RepID=A0A939DGT3_9GAMM|nr:MauE/DoxX family redox-associated membrane protein [Parahaliea mediterranea]MBN7797591.1 hypothetical protein [Parahaliea mediterranea]
MDPLLYTLLALCFGLLFAQALAHKLADFPRFTGVLRGYLRGLGIRSPWAVHTLASLVVLAETLALLCCLLPVGAVPRAVAVAAPLLAYALAMAANIRRGHRLLDCGCSWGAARQAISMGLVYRNVALAIAALTMLLPVTSRALVALDVLSILAATSVAALGYSVVNATLALNHSLAEE